MIEVEKKFRPIKEQLDKMLADAQFKGEKVLEDFYFDYPDYRLFKKQVYFRKRNGNFELKIGDDEIAGVCEEIENEEGIKKYFQTDKAMNDFVAENLINTLHWVCTRKKYTLGEFAIDIDSLDFGYECVEIEVMVHDASQVGEAQKRIIDFAQNYGFRVEDVPPKRKEYFRKVKPEVYNQLYETR